MSSLPSTRDIRSPSIPRLRYSSQRAKYGGRPPPTDALLISHPADIISQPSLGKPTTDLTSKEKYQIAQETVGRLIGKRVNRHNQRTGERDPWRYWGAGKRWGKLEARGMMEVRGAEEVCEDIEGGERDGRVRSEPWVEEVRRGGRGGRGFNWCGALEMGEVYEGDAMGVVVEMRDADEVEKYKVENSKRWKRRTKRTDDGEEWEFVKDCWEEVDVEDDGWDVVSISSAPG